MTRVSPVSIWVTLRHGLRLAGGATFTDATITGPARLPDTSTPDLTDTVPNPNKGNTPRRQAKLVYQLSPSYSFGNFELGAAIIGTGKSWGNDENTITQPGFTVVNAYGNYQVNEKLSLSLSVNNLGNAVGYTEVEGDGHASRSVNGRTVKAGLKYTF